MGTHIVNIGGHLLKKRIRNGKVISEEVHKSDAPKIDDHHDSGAVDLEAIK